MRYSLRLDELLAEFGHLGMFFDPDGRQSVDHERYDAHLEAISTLLRNESE